MHGDHGFAVHELGALRGKIEAIDVPEEHAALRAQAVGCSGSGCPSRQQGSVSERSRHPAPLRRPTQSAPPRNFEPNTEPTHSRSSDTQCGATVPSPLAGVKFVA